MTRLRVGATIVVVELFFIQSVFAGKVLGGTIGMAERPFFLFVLALSFVLSAFLTRRIVVEVRAQEQRAAEGSVR